MTINSVEYEEKFGKKRLDQTIKEKQTATVPYNVHEMGRLIYKVSIPLVDFSDCDRRTNKYTRNYSDICKHTDDQNPFNHPLNKKIVDIRDIKLHKAKRIRLTYAEILEVINEDHNEDWVKYDSHDWIDGLTEWTFLRFAEDQFYEMFFNVIELGHGISSHDDERRRKAEQEKRNHPWGIPSKTKPFIRSRRTCRCVRHRQDRARKGGYYANDEN